jgi:hypothetical protein
MFNTTVSIIYSPRLEVRIGGIKGEGGGDSEEESGSNLLFFYVGR